MSLRIGDKIVDLKSLLRFKYVFNYNWVKQECRIHRIDCGHYKGRKHNELGSTGGWSQPYDTVSEAYQECLKRVGRDSILGCNDCLWESLPT